MRGFRLALIAAVAAFPAMAQDAASPMQRKATEASADRLLDEQLLSAPERRARAEAKLAQPLPQTEDKYALGEALAARGAAALILGRQIQAAQDYARAAELLSGQDRAEALYNLAQASLNTGHYAKAIALLRRSNSDETNNASILRNLALIAEQHGKLGQVEPAAAALKEAETLASRLQAERGDRNPIQSMWRRVNVLRCEIAVLQAQGRVAETEPLIRKVIAAYEEAPNTRNTYVVGNRYQQLAEQLRGLGRLADAETEARAALAIYQRTVGPSSQRTGSALQTLGRIIAEQGRIKDGEALVRKGQEVIQAAGIGGNGGSRVALADILAMDYRWKEAREQFDLARKGFADEPELFEGITRRNSNYALALLKTGAAAEALAVFSAAYGEHKAKLGESAPSAALSRGLAAAALAALGRDAEAMAEFAATLPALTAQESDEDQETGNKARDQKLRLILESYMDLLSRTKATPDFNPVAESFRVADAARGRTVQRALAASATRAAAGNPAIADLARRAQDSDKQIAALSGLLANAISARADEQDADGIETLKKRIAGLRLDRADALKRIAEKFPEYGRMLNPQPATVAEIQAKLKPGEAMLAFYSAEDRAYGWAIPASGAPAMATAPLGRLALDGRIKRLREALDLSVAGIDEIPDFDLKSAHDLYAALIQPTEAAWAGAETLFTVPHGPLGQLPLALLPTKPPAAAPSAKDKAAKPAPAGPLFAKYREVPWLARKAAIAQLPSVNALATLRALPERHAPRRDFIAFGDPIFSKDQALEAAGDASALASRGFKRRAAPKPNPDFSADLAQLPRLPDTAEEVKSIAAVLKADPDQDLFLQARATESAVRKTDLSKWRVVMFATHGLVPGDLAGLEQPALALTSPQVSGDGSSGVLTMEAVMGLKLDADWVVLSACNTAAGEGSGAEAVSGLGRAFFYAGARALLVSNWPVETVSARMLTTDLFRRQAEDPTLSRAQAMRRAMLALMDGPGALDGAGKEQYVYAHPTFWAPFSLVGDGG